MSGKTRLALKVLGCAAVLGLAADAVIEPAWGLGACLLSFLLVIASLWVSPDREESCPARGAWLAPLALLFSSLLLFRDSPTLKCLDVLAFGMVLSLMVFHLEDGQVFRVAVTEYVLCCARALGGSLKGFPLLLRKDIQWKECAQPAYRENVVAVTRGLLLAAPILLVFGALLASADAVFGKLVGDVLQVDVSEVEPHLFRIAAFTWLAGGLLRTLAFREVSTATIRQRVRSFWLGTVEVGAVLGSMNLLFAFFVFIQFRYFFGGAAAVHSIAGMTYAQYARHGFFELVTVALLVLLLLLWVHWALRAEEATCHGVFRLLAAIQLLLVGVILVSALRRMQLYCEVYGITELRFYTTVFMIWLGLVLVWFAATVLRGARDRFAAGALFTGLGVILLLHVCSPDAWIARANVARHRAIGALDTGYLSRLSADVVPALVDALPTLKPEDQALLREALLREWSRPQNPDWRTWSFARHSAWNEVRRLPPAPPVSRFSSERAWVPPGR